MTSQHQFHFNRVNYSSVNEVLNDPMALQTIKRDFFSTTIPQRDDEFVLQAPLD